MLCTITRFYNKLHTYYGTAQFKIDTRVQQTRVHLTDFVETHASYSHAVLYGTRAYMHDRIHCPRASIHSTRHARAMPRGTPEAYRTQTDALAWLMHGVKLIKWKGLALSYISARDLSKVLRHSVI